VYFVVAEEKTAHARCAGDLQAWKNKCCEEEAEREKLSKLVKDTEADYVKAVAHSRDVGNALEPILEEFVPLEPAVDPPPSFLDRVQQLGDKLNDYVQDSVRQTVKQVLASVQAYHPTLDLGPLSQAIPDECSQEEYQALAEKFAPLAAEYVKDIFIGEEKNNQ
jgi:hypothetical protein